MKKISDTKNLANKIIQKKKTNLENLKRRRTVKERREKELKELRNTIELRRYEAKGKVEKVRRGVYERKKHKANTIKTQLIVKNKLFNFLILDLEGRTKKREDKR